MKCTNSAAYRFTWPGRDESFICEQHKPKLEGVAAAMGFYIQVVPLTPEEREGKFCNQILSDNRRIVDQTSS